LQLIGYIDFELYDTENERLGVFHRSINSPDDPLNIKKGFSKQRVANIRIQADNLELKTQLQLTDSDLKKAFSVRKRPKSGAWALWVKEKYRENYLGLILFSSALRLLQEFKVTKIDLIYTFIPDYYLQFIQKSKHGNAIIRDETENLYSDFPAKDLSFRSTDINYNISERFRGLTINNRQFFVFTFKKILKDIFRESVYWKAYLTAA